MKEFILNIQSWFLCAMLALPICTVWTMIIVSIDRSAREA
jgi:hypothetical protein